MGNFGTKNIADWKNVHQQIFGSNIPESKEWTDINEIISILNTIGSIPDSNHTLFPISGGLDLEGATLSKENGCIELDFGFNNILKPKKLTYHKVDDNLEWSYFYLETDELPVSGVYEYEEDDFEICDEDLVDLGNGKYIGGEHWDEQEYDGAPFPQNARSVSRWFRNVAFATFKKTSIYNNDTRTYDGRHNEMTPEAFREHIQKYYEKVGNDPIEYPDNDFDY